MPLSDIRIDHDGIGRYLKGPEVRSLVRGSAEEVEALYRASVAKRTGRLAGSTRIETFIGGRKNDRWCARLIANTTYAAPHEFGYDTEDGRHVQGSHELAKALDTWRRM